MDQKTTRIMQTRLSYDNQLSTLSMHRGQSPNLRNLAEVLCTHTWVARRVCKCVCIEQREGHVGCFRKLSGNLRTFTLNTLEQGLKVLQRVKPPTPNSPRSHSFPCAIFLFSKDAFVDIRTDSLPNAHVRDFQSFPSKTYMANTVIETECAHVHNFFHSNLHCQYLNLPAAPAPK
jgi:hypothetical protein